MIEFLFYCVLSVCKGKQPNIKKKKVENVSRFICQLYCASCSTCSSFATVAVTCRSCLGVLFSHLIFFFETKPPDLIYLHEVVLGVVILYCVHCPLVGIEVGCATCLSLQVIANANWNFLYSSCVAKCRSSSVVYSAVYSLIAPSGE